MVTRDVLKVLKLHSPTARAILRTFKTSLMLINPEMHSRSYDFLYLCICRSKKNPCQNDFKLRGGKKETMALRRWGVIQDNFVLSTELIM